jgi:hypothetical protein
MKVAIFSKQRRDQEWGGLQLHSPAYLYVMHKGFACTWKSEQFSASLARIVRNM